jgi:hypothetical protein
MTTGMSRDKNWTPSALLRRIRARRPLLPGCSRESTARLSVVGASTGVALFELYDLDAETGRVANVSTRSRIEAGDKVLIGGLS